MALNADKTQIVPHIQSNHMRTTEKVINLKRKYLNTHKKTMHRRKKYKSRETNEANEKPNHRRGSFTRFIQKEKEINTKQRKRQHQ